MFGQLMSGMRNEGDPDLETQWSQALKRPDIQAGLLNFGIELMKPRWSGASALPDALAAGARGVGGVQEEEYNRQRTAEKEALAQSEKAADRENRLETARIGADSRAEVANIRTAGMLEGIRTRDELKNRVTGAFTPEERKEIKDRVKTLVELRKNDFTKLGQPVDEIALEKHFTTQIENDVIARRARMTFGGNANAGDNPSANPPTGGGPVGQPGAAPASKNPSANPSPSAATKPTVQRVISSLESKGWWTGSPAQIEAWRALVSDPETFDRLKTPSRGNTQDALRKMYEGQ